MASSDICGCKHKRELHFDDANGTLGTTCAMNGCNCTAFHKPTAAELETIVLSTRTLLAEHEKAWHDALVRESRPYVSSP